MAKLNDFQKLMEQWSSFARAPKRETALDNEGLGMIGRPLDQMSDEEKEQLYAPVEQPIEEIPVEQEQPAIEQEPDFITKNEDIGEAVIDKPMNEPAELSYKDIMGKEQEAAPKSKEEQLIEEYNNARKQYESDVNAGYEKDRKSQMVQGIIQNLGKALTYSGFAGAKTMSNPMPLEMKPIDMKYADQAKDVGKTKLDSYKELINQLKTSKSKGYKTQILQYPDRTDMVTYNDEGDILKTQKLSDKVMSEYQKKNVELKEQDREDKNRRAEVANKIRERGQKYREDYLAFQKQNKDELSDPQTKHITGIDSTLLMGNKLDGMLNGADDVLGFYSSTAESLKKFIPGAEQDERFTDIQAMITALKAEYIRLQSGTAASDKEVLRLGGYIPDVDDKPSTFKRKLDNYMDTLQQIRRQEFDNLKKYQGKTFASEEVNNAPSKKTELKRQYSPSQDKTYVTYSDNTIEALDGRQTK